MNIWRSFPFSPFGSGESCDVSSLGRDFCHELAKVLTECQYTMESVRLICFEIKSSERVPLKYVRATLAGKSGKGRKIRKRQENLLSKK